MCIYVRVRAGTFSFVRARVSLPGLGACAQSLPPRALACDMIVFSIYVYLFLSIFLNFMICNILICNILFWNYMGFACDLLGNSRARVPSFLFWGFSLRITFAEKFRFPTDRIGHELSLWLLELSCALNLLFVKVSQLLPNYINLHFIGKWSVSFV